MRALESAAVSAGLLAVGALVFGSTILVRETRIAVAISHERAASLRDRARRA